MTNRIMAVVWTVVAGVNTSAALRADDDWSQMLSCVLIALSILLAVDNYRKGNYGKGAE